MRANPTTEEMSKRTSLILGYEAKSVPIEDIIESLGLTLEYQYIRKNGRILGETVFDDDYIPIYNMEAKQYELIFVERGTIILDASLLRCRTQAEELISYIGRIDDGETIAKIKDGIRYQFQLMRKRKPIRTGYILSLCPKCRAEFFSVPENILMTVPTMASLLGIREATAYELIHRLHFRSVKTEYSSQRLLIDKATFYEWLENQTHYKIVEGKENFYDREELSEAQ